MPTLDSDSYADLVLAAQRHLGKMKFSQIAQDKQEYHALTHIFRDERAMFGGGRGVQRQLMYRHSGQATHSGLYDTDTVAVQDVMTQITVPPRFTKVAYAYDEREEAMNSGPDTIFDLIKVKRADALIGLAELVESTLWGRPTTNTDVKTPWTIRYYCVRWPAGTTTPGFNSQNPTAADNTVFSDRAGVDSSSSTYSNWRNWCGQYTDVTKTDLIRKMRKMYRFINFRAPVDTPGYERGRDRYVIYTNYNVLQPLEEAAEAQNDSLGTDVASMDGRTVFRRAPIEWVPQLEDDAGDPVYMINWSVFYPFFQRGWFLRESKPQIAPNQHNVRHVWVDLIWNTLCVDCRRLGVLSKDSSTGTTS